MLFEVLKNDGKGNLTGIMCSDYESCVYPADTLESMYSVGYLFKVNGVIVSLPDGARSIAKEVQKAVKRAIKQGVGIPISADSPAPAEIETPKSDKPKLSRKVICIETGEVFNTQSEAAKHFKIDPAQVSDSIKTGKARSGYTFERYDEDDS